MQRHVSALQGSQDGSPAAPVCVWGGGGGGHSHGYTQTHTTLHQIKPVCAWCEGFAANLPSQSRDKLLKGQATLSVGEDGVEVLLSWGHVQHGHFVNLSAK